MGLDLDCDRTGVQKEMQHLHDQDRVRHVRGSKRMGCKMKLVLKACHLMNHMVLGKLFTLGTEVESIATLRLQTQECTRVIASALPLVKSFSALAAWPKLWWKRLLLLVCL
ncbi:hypothetical protein F444_12116 [Phytophthora nicotianae P1976]|uniref:Uncharacterized protein n=1 Tax=Phytophthora nicotianae P1976 TaxID=1317066 RepID=A0A080ZY56_PHYNI|nr:hypothetical protein F444_12116 [Phytophthora nicotianae P1976]